MTTRRIRCSGSTSTSSDSDEEAAASPLRPLRKRKPSADADGASTTRQVRSKSQPVSQALVSFPVAGVPPREVADDDGDDDRSDDETSVAEQGIKLFPHLSQDEAAAMWVGFFNNAKTCINHYNKKNQANFAYKHARGNGFFLVMEQDWSDYYHLNFLARDRNDGHSQLFFGEIKTRVAPKEEDVTCCCPVSPSDAGGRSIRTIEEALKKHVYPTDWEKVGMDYEHCYACLPRFKHPKGTCYVGGHFADSRQYYGF